MKNSCVNRSVSNSLQCLRKVNWVDLDKENRISDSEKSGEKSNTSRPRLNIVLNA